MQIYAETHMITDNSDPIDEASPMGKSVSVKYFEARYESGILAAKIDMLLCMNEIPDLFIAQKYPLKQK